MGRPIRSRLIGMAALAALALAAGAASAAGASRIGVGLNQSLRIALDGVASNVVVANSAIADVTMIDAHSAIVVGKSLGTSEVMVLDAGGRVLLDGIVTVSPHFDRGGLDSEITLYRGPLAEHYSCSPRCESEGHVSGPPAGAPAS